MFCLTLPARGQFDICLTCPFQDRCLSCHRFLSAQDDFDGKGDKHQFLFHDQDRLKACRVSSI
jgi:hypothetical protein